MSTVRLTNADKTYGYGVDGFSRPRRGRRITVALEDYLSDIPYNFNSPFPDPITQFLVSMRWRIKLQVTNFGSFNQKIFNADLGRGIFGEYAVGYREYFADSGFISFQTHISKLYHAQFMLEVADTTEPVLPCDEPPDDLDLTIERQFPIINNPSSQFLPGFNQLVSWNDGSRKPVNIGTSYTFSPSYPDLEYIAGITYEYVVTYYDERTVLESNPVTIGL